LNKASLDLAISRLENDALRQEAEELKDTNSKLREERNTLKWVSNRYRKQLAAAHKKKPTKVLRKQIVTEVLAPFFTEIQISCFLRGTWQRVKEWNQDDISLALTLKLLSPKTYNFLRSKKIVPLPGRSTLQNHFKHFQIPEGYLSAVGRLMKIKAQELTPRERVAALCFDEVYLRKEMSYDNQEDCIIGPHQRANTMLLRGIFKRWKIPVWYQFDSNLSKDLLFDIIKEVEGAGYHVVSITSDMGSTNLGLAKKLGITTDDPSFEHPCRPGHKIWWFYDVPHLLKLVRNNLINHGFRLSSGTVINKAMLQRLFDKLTGEVRMAPKLTIDLINVKNQDRMKVYKAARLLSSSTAQAIQLHFPDDEEMLEMADFILQVDRWFDTLDSRCKLHQLKTVKCGYEVHLTEQTLALQKLSATMKAMTVLCPKKSRMSFQKGIQISAASLIAIFPYLQSEYGIEYVFSSRFNQDCLENTFSRMRAMGTFHTQFNALAYKQRLRCIIFGACERLAVTTAAVLCTEDSDPILTKELTREYVKDVSWDEIVPVPALDDVLGDLAKVPPTLPTSEKEGMNYFAGYLASQSGAESSSHRIVNNNLAHNDEFVASEWLDKRNIGGLSYPSKTLVEDITLMDDMFKDFHQSSTDGLRRDKNITKTLKSLLMKEFPQYPEELLRKFSVSRTVFRMRCIQKEMKPVESSGSKKKIIDHQY
jgi:hypothetical protein